MRPVDAKWAVTQGFGGGATAGVDPYGSHPMAPYVRMYGDYQPYGHAGEDIGCPVGTPVYAMSAGTVLWADWGTNLPGDDTDAGYRQRYYLYKGFPGIVTVIQHSWGKGVYAHLSSNDAAPRGTKVKEGQLIGYSGDTGGVAPHLHVEALINDAYPTGGGLIYGRTNPAKFYGTTTPAKTQSATTGGLTVTDIKTISNQLAELLERTKPINTSSGPVTLREFVAKGTRAAETAVEQTAPINVSGGKQEGIRDFIAQGTRAAQRIEARMSALEATIAKAIETPGADLATLTAAAEAGASKALSNLRLTNEKDVI